MHGSAWPSHRGGGRLENSFVHPSFDASCAAPGSQTRDGDVVVCLEDAAGRAADDGVVSVLAAAATADAGFASPMADVENATDGSPVAAGYDSGTLEHVWKNPFNDCWPFAIGTPWALGLELEILGCLTDLLGDADADARRFLDELRGLVACTGEPFVENKAFVAPASPVPSSAFCVGEISAAASITASAEGNAAILGTADFLVNMSRMF